MKLFNVTIGIGYTTPGYYSETIDLSYSKLVVAKSEGDAMNFVKKDLREFESLEYTDEKIVSIHEIDFERVQRKRKTGYYKF